MPETPEPQRDERRERLDALEAEIEEARRKAQDDGVLPGRHERTFADPDGDGV